MSIHINEHRRHFLLGTASMTVAATQLGVAGPVGGSLRKHDAATALRRGSRREHIFPLTEADQCRRPECRLRRSGPG